MKYFVGLIALVAVVAGATVVGYHYFQNEVETRAGGGDNGGVISSATTAPTSIPNQNQVIVLGSVTALHVEGAIIRSLGMPLTITTPQRGDGAGAGIKGVQVDGKDTEIEWDAGTPLVLDGEGGSLVTGPVTIDADATNTTINLGTDPFGFAAGTYTIQSSVAVGTGSLARPADSVTLTAGDAASVVFRGDATTTFPSRPLTAKGTGKVTLTGALTVVKPDRSQTTIASASLDAGQFDLTMSVEGSALQIKITLQGNVTTA